MKRNNIRERHLNLLLVAVFISFILIFETALVSAAYVRANPALSRLGSQAEIGNAPSFSDFDKRMCEAGQDFLLQIQPFGCTPAVVRSDLLEEQDVTILCKISATQLNPLIDISAIDYISISGEYPREVKAVGYFPAKAALGRYGASLREVNYPLLENIGYVSITLAREGNESAMPDFVEGNLSARIRYDIENAFGVGQAVFYLPLMDDDEWEKNFRGYGFWQGRGYLRAENVEDNAATISVYGNRNYGISDSGKIVLATETLEKGQKPRYINMPGFDYCLGRMQLELKGVESEDTRARIKVNGDPFELKDNEPFLEQKCVVEDLDKRGALQEVKINCREDDGGKKYRLILSPSVEIEIKDKSNPSNPSNPSQDINANFSIGDKIYSYHDEGILGLGIFRDGTKSVYLAYVGTDEQNREESLGVVFVSLPGQENKLSLDELAVLQRQINWLSSVEEISNIRSIPGSLIKGYSSLGEMLFRKLKDGQNLNFAVFEKANKIFGDREVKVKGFSGAFNADLSPDGLKDAREAYENAVADYERIKDDFSQEKYPQGDPTTLGEKSLRRLIFLASSLNQNKDVLDYCAEFNKNYESLKPEICDDLYRLSNQETSSVDVKINGKFQRLSFEGIKEPSFDDYGTTISIIDSETGKSISAPSLRKNQIYYINLPESTSESKREFIQLLEVNEDSIKIRTNLNIEKTTDKLKSFFLETDTKTLRKDEVETFGSKYVFSILDINLEKVAKVSVNPRINRAETKAEFPFKIGIEKRDIKLSPEKTAELIEKWKKVHSVLESAQGVTESAVKVFNTACLATGTYLTAKNFFGGLSGEGIARQKVMRAPDKGWYDICEREKNQGSYDSVDACLLDKSDEIDDSVEKYAKEIRKMNGQLDKIEEDVSGGDTRKILEEFLSGDYKGELSENIDGLETIEVDGKDVAVSDIIGVINKNSTSLTEARELLLNARLLNSDNEFLRGIAKQEIRSNLGSIWRTSQPQVQVANVLTNLANAGLEGIQASVYVSEGGRVESYNGYVTPSGFSRGDIGEGVALRHVQYKGGDFLLQLNKAGERYGVAEIYSLTGKRLSSDTLNYYEEIKENFIFEKIDAGSYKNEFIDPKVRYYETGPYKGVPAIVPFDVKNGWYAAVKSTVPIFGSVRGVDDSGVVSSLWIGNVGGNGRQEFDIPSGDDKYMLINLGTGQPYDIFPGLSEREASDLVGKARNAIEQAQRQYGKGVSKIVIDVRGSPAQTINVGEPYIGTPSIQCQDFMSPSDCNLLFNACDPVVCPSSRCDFGGNYPVSDVIQSGIGGGLLLCAPNWPEVKVPVCLSGINAGLENLISVSESFQSCLNTSLEKGQTVGICDEISSVYMCELLWRQALPAAQVLAPRIIGKALGQESSGGGEYLTVQSAFDNAKSSVDFFTKNYAQNSFAAFKARNIENAGTQVCQTAIYASYPTGGNIFDALIEPASPSQFYGRFEEIPYTTATNPPTSQYKVFYHIYAGKDSRAYYEVYLKGTGSSFFRDAPLKRVVDFGFISAGEYATNTKDFTAPSGYKEMCIAVNGREECGFQEVTTSFAVNYIQDIYVREQAEKTDIKSERECVAGTPNIMSLLNPNVQAGAEEIANPSIYDRGIIRVCSTDNPGIATDPSRWKNVGNCGNENVGCWLDKQSVGNVIKNAKIEGELLQSYENKSLEALREENPSYIAQFDNFVEEVMAIDNSLEVIEKISANLGNVFENYKKAEMYFLRGNAYGKIAMRVYQGFVKERAGEAGSVTTGKDEGSGEGGGGEAASLSCIERDECQKVLGNEIIKIARDIKESKGDDFFDDETVFKDTGAKSFECLVLQVAHLESEIQQCGSRIGREFQENGNPLYCENNFDKVLKGDDGNSIGTMQINTAVHRPEDTGDLTIFENNVRFGINHLINLYDSEPKIFRCYEQTPGNTVSESYSGWQRALRAYNGWVAPPCYREDEEGRNRPKGNLVYVDSVLNRQDEVKELFREECGSSK